MGIAAIGMAAAIAVIGPALLKDKLTVRSYRLAQQFFVLISCLVIASCLLTAFDRYEGRDVRKLVEDIDRYLAEKLSVETDSDARIDQDTKNRLNRQIRNICNYITTKYRAEDGSATDLECSRKLEIGKAQ
jgi:hypothetical protein